jgi:hypothetical protein
MLALTRLSSLLLCAAVPAAAQTLVFDFELDSVATAPRLLVDVGDMNGDGHSDFATSTGSKNPELRIYSGVSQQEIRRHSLTFAAFDAAGLGDVDGDGHDDYAYTDASAVYALNGNLVVRSGATGVVLLTVDHSAVGVDSFGSCLAAIGDADGDGARDLVVRAGISFGLPVVEYELIALSSRTGAELYRVPPPLDSNARNFARSIAGLGDIDGDGVGDLIASDPAIAGLFQGRAMVYSGASGALIERINGQPDSSVWPSRVARIGDVDGDGRDDVLTSGRHGRSPQTVQVWSTGTWQEIHRIDSAFAAGLTIGYAVSALPDTNGDGVEDFAIGAVGDNGVVDRGGAVHVHSGASGSLLYSIIDPQVRRFQGRQVLGIDLTGDGNGDVIGLAGSNAFYSNERIRGYRFDRSPTVFDFATDDSFDRPLRNGEDVDSGARFGKRMIITGTGPGTVGAAVFATDPQGPNALAEDQDLLVGRGNALILQESGTPGLNGTYRSPDDSQFGGRMRFDLVGEAEPLYMDLVDICPGLQSVLVQQVDDKGRRRTHFVAAGFTADGSLDPVHGVGRLDLTSLRVQPGVTANAVASEDPGFDQASVVRIDVSFGGSGAIAELSMILGG